MTFSGFAQAPYELNSCKIDFVFATGNLQKGTKTLVFTDSGYIEKELSVTYIDTSGKTEIPKEVLGSRTVYNTLVIQTRDSVNSIDLDLMIGRKRTKYGSDLASFVYDSKIKVGEDTFLTKKCDIIDIEGVKLWYWKGIVLKKELPIDGVYEYAVSIDEDYSIKADEFLIPKNVKMQ